MSNTNEKAHSVDPAIARIEKATEIIKEASDLLVKTDSTYVVWDKQHFAVQQLILGAMLEFSNTEKAELETDLAKSQEKCKAYEEALQDIEQGATHLHDIYDKYEWCKEEAEQALKPNS